MSDDLRNRGRPERECVHLSEDWEIKYWSEKFGVDEIDLKNAVVRVGPMVSDIEAFFDSTLDMRAITGLPHHKDQH